MRLRYLLGSSLAGDPVSVDAELRFFGTGGTQSGWATCDADLQALHCCSGTGASPLPERHLAEGGRGGPIHGGAPKYRRLR